MVEVLLWIAAVFWIILFLQMVINRILTRDLSRLIVPQPEQWPFVSIVVPARNEEREIRNSVSSFCSQDYCFGPEGDPSFEVIVVNDCSTDGTSHILSELQKQFSHLKVVRGGEPPEGWFGKQNALESGKREAKGEWFLFADADVVYEPELLRKAIAYALQEEAGMLVLIPKNTVKGLVETLCIAGLYFLFTAVFPIFLVSRTKNRLFAAGTGAFNMVRRNALNASGAFKSLRNQIVDDVALGYKVKGAGFKIALAMTGCLVKVRMYHGAKESINGFTKNTYPLFKSVWWIVPFLYGFGFVLSFLPYIGFFISLFSIDGTVRSIILSPAFIALFFMHATMAGIAFLYKLPWYITVLHPVHELLWWWIFFRSMFFYLLKGVEWRGRSYNFPQ